MGNKVAERLKKLQERKRLVVDRIQKLEASSKAADRKRELQKKVLVGAYFLEQAHQNNTMAELNAAMLGHLERTCDRKLFEQHDSYDTTKLPE